MGTADKWSFSISNLYDRLGKLKAAIKNLEKQAIEEERYEDRASFLLDEVVAIIVEDLKLKPF